MEDPLLQLGNWSPLVDALVEKLGLGPAVVFGVVHRHCRMKTGKCFASIETIARLAGVSYRSAARHINRLCQEGYLYDQTPTMRHRPHILTDTGKAECMSEEYRWRRSVNGTDLSDNEIDLSDNQTDKETMGI